MQSPRITPGNTFTARFLSYMEGLLLLAVLALLGWLMMLSGPVFPMNIVLTLVCVASPFVVAPFAWLLHRRRGHSAAHRIAYYATVTFLAALAVSICAGAFYSSRSISTEALVGVYLPDPATRADIEQRLHLLTPNHKIELRGDGTFAMTDVPDFWPHTESPTSLISAIGKWSPQARKVAIEYTGATVIPPTGGAEERYFATIQIIGFFAPYRLRVILGDPDSDYSATFAKTQ